MKIKKEAIIAIIIGIVIGLIITGGILRAKKALENSVFSGDNNPTSDLTSNIESADNSELFLDIVNPEDNVIVSTSTITLTGNTSPDTYIAIITESNEYLIIPNEVGTFTQDLRLIKGANTITITVYTETGTKIEKTLNIVYTSAEI